MFGLLVNFSKDVNIKYCYLWRYLLSPGMSTRPQPHEAEAEATTHEAEAKATTHKAEAEATTHEAEAEAKTHLEILISII